MAILILILSSGAKKNAPQLLDLFVSRRGLDKHSPGSIWVRVGPHSNPLGSVWSILRETRHRRRAFGNITHIFCHSGHGSKGVQ